MDIHKMKKEQLVIWRELWLVPNDLLLVLLLLVLCKSKFEVEIDRLQGEPGRPWRNQGIWIIARSPHFFRPLDACLPERQTEISRNRNITFVIIFTYTTHTFVSTCVVYWITESNLQIFITDVFFVSCNANLVRDGSVNRTGHFQQTLHEDGGSGSRAGLRYCVASVLTQCLSSHTEHISQSPCQILYLCVLVT